jgi:hypothetical protein
MWNLPRSVTVMKLNRFQTSQYIGGIEALYRRGARGRGQGQMRQEQSAGAVAGQEWEENYFHFPYQHSHFSLVCCSTPV